MRPLFIIGNKRSGTSLLVRLLNLHPEIYISHESDVLWILYQLYHAKTFLPHPWDSARGMLFTLKRCAPLLDRQLSPMENFERIQRRLMEGTPWQSQQNKLSLKYIGDKKPFQNADSRLLEFVKEHLHEARFLHLVRHPFDVALSSEEFNQTVSGDFWLNTTLEEKLVRWTFHENQVLQNSRHYRFPIHRLRYEDLCRDTEATLKAVFQFLEIKGSNEILKNSSILTNPSVYPKKWIPYSSETDAIAQIYGYDLSPPHFQLWNKGEVLYWRAFKRLIYGSLPLSNDS